MSMLLWCEHRRTASPQILRSECVRFVLTTPYANTCVNECHNTTVDPRSLSNLVFMTVNEISVQVYTPSHITYTHKAEVPASTPPFLSTFQHYIKPIHIHLRHPFIPINHSPSNHSRTPPTLKSRNPRTITHRHAIIRTIQRPSHRRRHTPFRLLQNFQNLMTPCRSHRVVVMMRRIHPQGFEG